VAASEFEVSPASGPFGTVVTIRAANLDLNNAAVAVQIDNPPVAHPSAHEIQFTMPPFASPLTGGAGEVIGVQSPEFVADALVFRPTWSVESIWFGNIVRAERFGSGLLLTVFDLNAERTAYYPSLSSVNELLLPWSGFDDLLVSEIVDSNVKAYLVQNHQLMRGTYDASNAKVDVRQVGEGEVIANLVRAGTIENDPAVWVARAAGVQRLRFSDTSGAAATVPFPAGFSKTTEAVRDTADTLYFGGTIDTKPVAVRLAVGAPAFEVLPDLPGAARQALGDTIDPLFRVQSGDGDHIVAWDHATHAWIDRGRELTPCDNQRFLRNGNVGCLQKNGDLIENVVTGAIEHAVGGPWGDSAPRAVVTDEGEVNILLTFKEVTGLAKRAR